MKKSKIMLIGSIAIQVFLGLLTVRVCYLIVEPLRINGAMTMFSILSYKPIGISLISAFTIFSGFLILRRNNNTSPPLIVLGATILCASLIFIYRLVNTEQFGEQLFKIDRVEYVSASYFEVAIVLTVISLWVLLLMLGIGKIRKPQDEIIRDNDN